MTNSTEPVHMTCQGTVENMDSCRETNNAVLTINIWPSLYSRDCCHTAKCEPNWRVSTNQDPSVSAMKLSLAA
jgi:hypothetical protein